MQFRKCPWTAIPHSTLSPIADESFPFSLHPICSHSHTLCKISRQPMHSSYHNTKFDRPQTHIHCHFADEILLDSHAQTHQLMNGQNSDSYAQSIHDSSID